MRTGNRFWKPATATLIMLTGIAALGGCFPTSPNGPPVADAGRDLVLGLQDVIVLDGTGSSDPDGVPLSFTWEQTDGPDVALSATDIAQAEVLGALWGVYVFRLTVSDGRGGSDQAEVTVTVTDPEAVLPPNPLSIVITEALLTFRPAESARLSITVQPDSSTPDPSRPYAPGYVPFVYFLLDRNCDPTDDNPRDLESADIVVLETVRLESNSFEPYTMSISLDEIPVPEELRETPLFIRVTLCYGRWPCLHAYADMQIILPGEEADSDMGL